jgi:hypothetical protein
MRGDELPDQRRLAGARFARNGNDPPPPFRGECECTAQPPQLFVAL